MIEYDDENMEGITLREKTQVRKLGKDQEEVLVSHNAGDRILNLLDNDIKKKWRIRPLFTRNKDLPENTGFIYEAKKLVMFKFLRGQLLYSVVSEDLIKIAMVRNSVRA